MQHNFVKPHEFLRSQKEWVEDYGVFGGDTKNGCGTGVF